MNYSILKIKMKQIMKKKEFDNDGEDDIIYKDLYEDGGLILLLIIKI